MAVRAGSLVFVAAALLLCGLLPGCLGQLHGFTITNKPDVNYDYSAYVPDRLGNKGWHYGSATYYGGDYPTNTSSTGNCGFHPFYVNNTMAQQQTAVPDPRFSSPLTAGVSSFSGAACGQCFHIQCAQQPRYANMTFCHPNNWPVLVRVTDYDIPGTGFLPNGSWPKNHFDLNPAVFGTIADLSAGIINIRFRRVSCYSQLAGQPKGPKWTIFSDSNGWWRDIGIYDTPGVGNIVAAYVKPSNDPVTHAMSHNWGSRWSFGGNQIIDGDSVITITYAEGKGNATAHYVQL